VGFQGYSGDVAQSVAYMIPTPVINRFLKDVSNGHYDKYVDLAISYSKLQNPAQRKFLGLKDDDRGVLVNTVVEAGPSVNILRPGDVLLTHDGHSIAVEGNVELEGERADFQEVVERKFKGDSVKLDIWRDKQPMTVKIEFLKTAWPYLIQGHSYDVRPRYVLYGGLLFQPLNLDLMEAYRPTDLRLRHFFEYFILEQLYLQHPDVIVLANILPDPINTYLAPYRGGIVDEINGKKIRTLDDLVRMLAETPERFGMRMIGDGPALVLDRNNVTGQSYDDFRPWQKKAPFSKRALGAVLSKGRVLVTADLVANQNYVELERAESGEKTAAKVQVIDYEANLALLEPMDKT